jgi:two-component system, OmpR family, sensor histidine kinase KdpD
MVEKPTRSRVVVWIGWLGALVIVSGAMTLVRNRLEKVHIALILLLVVLGGSAGGGRAVGFSLAGGAFLIFDWFFLPPYYTLVVADPLDWLVLLTFLVTGAVAAQLLTRLQEEAELARRRASELERLATLGAETLNVARAEQALVAIADVIRAALKADRCEIFLRDGRTSLTLVAESGPEEAVGAEPEDGILSYVLQNGTAAARRADGTLTIVDDGFPGLTDGGHTGGSVRSLKDLTAIALPLTVRGRTVGVLRLAAATALELTVDQRRVLEALAYYAALGAERVRLTAAEDEAVSLRRADRLKDALLASVSHDLRTPLTTIKGIAHEVGEGGDPAKVAVIEEEADRMSRLVEDLLDLSQIAAGALSIETRINTSDDVMDAALQRTASILRDHVVQASSGTTGGLLAGSFDFSHTLRILSNLLENAAKYSPAASTVSLSAERNGNRLEFIVEDEGRGVADTERETIFGPFVRGREVPAESRGVGLGLSIARRLAEVQAGSIRYEPRIPRGSRFILSLPAVDVTVP